MADDDIRESGYPELDADHGRQPTLVLKLLDPDPAADQPVEDLFQIIAPTTNDVLDVKRTFNIVE